MQSSRRSILASVATLLLLVNSVLAAQCSTVGTNPFPLSLRVTSAAALLNNDKWTYYSADGKAAAHPPAGTACVVKLCTDIPSGVVTFTPLVNCDSPDNTAPEKMAPSTSGCFALGLDTVSNNAIVPRELSIQSICYVSSDTTVTAPVQIQFTNEGPTCPAVNVALIRDASTTAAASTPAPAAGAASAPPTVPPPSATFSLSGYDDRATYVLYGLKGVSGTLEQCSGGDFSLDGCGTWTPIPIGPAAEDVAVVVGTLRYNATASVVANVPQGAVVFTLTYQTTDVFDSRCNGTVVFKSFIASNPQVSIMAPLPIPKTVTGPFWVLLNATTTGVEPKILRWVPSMRDSASSACVLLCKGRLPPNATAMWIANNFDPAHAPSTAGLASCWRNAPDFLTVDVPAALASVATYTIVAVDPTQCKQDTAFSIGVRATDGVAYDRAIISSTFIAPKEGTCAAAEVKATSTPTTVSIAKGGSVTVLSYKAEGCGAGVKVAVAGAADGSPTIVPAGWSAGPLSDVVVSAADTAASGTCTITFYTTTPCTLKITVGTGGATTSAAPAPPQTTLTAAPVTTVAPPPPTTTTTAAPAVTTTTTAAPAPPVTDAPTTITTTTTPAPTTTAPSGPTPVPATTTNAPAGAGTPATTTSAPTTTGAPLTDAPLAGAAQDDTRLLSFPMIVLIAAFAFAAYYFRADIVQLARKATSGGFTPVATGTGGGGSGARSGARDDEDDDNAPLAVTTQAAGPKPLPKRPRVRRTSSDDESTGIQMRSRTPGGVRSTTPHTSQPEPKAKPVPKPAAPVTGWDAAEEEWE